MTATVLRNPVEADEAPLLAPLHEDGRNFAFAMYFAGGSLAAFADTVTELLGALIDEYEQASPEEQDLMRIVFAQTVAAQVQAQVLLDVDRDQVSASEWDALTTPRRLPQPAVPWWTSDVPLVVVETSYSPYTDVPAPVSSRGSGAAQSDNLWWVRPAEEEDFLISLHEVGYLKLMKALS
jgi:hypothetical protein